MSSERRKMVQLILLAAMVIAVIRVGVIFYERHEANRPVEKPQEKPLDADYYVTPKKFHAYDLATARELTKQPVWVREGYRFYYYPYSPSTHRADFRQKAGLLGPIEKIQITDVFQQATPGDPSSKQVMAVFEKGGKQYALPVGMEKGGDYQIVADEILFLEDPRALYKHWPSDVWAAIERHEVKPGMNELQASFAVGTGMPQVSDGSEKVVDYPNGGTPLEVTFRNGRATEIKAGQRSAEGQGSGVA